MFKDRLEKAQNLMREESIEAMLLSVGADLPYFTGYEAMPLERLTMLVIQTEGIPVLVIPKLEAPRVIPKPGLFEIHPWTEVEDPISVIVGLLRGTKSVAIGDTTWSRFTIEILKHLPNLQLRNASTLTSYLRAVKDPEELFRLQEASSAVDRIATRLQAGEIDLVGRTERQVSEEISRQIIQEGHQKVNFAIVAAGENAASPHHEPSSRLIKESEVVLCDFGGTMTGDDGVGYCSDITRCVWTGEPPQEFVEMYGVLYHAQKKQVQACNEGIPAQEVDRIGRNIIASAGYGENFIHRTGHGIGVEAHEDPYIVEGNTQPLEQGNVFSIEPGIYIPNKWGARLEDIVAVTGDGPLPLNTVDHNLAAIL
tara:strand:+ start:75 stop:1178 length:1104 start_codon:yes stop_codon:yes gene_type:complete